MPHVNNVAISACVIGLSPANVSSTLQILQRKMYYFLLSARVGGRWRGK